MAGVGCQKRVHGCLGEQLFPWEHLHNRLSRMERHIHEPHQPFGGLIEPKLPGFATAQDVQNMQAIGLGHGGVGRVQRIGQDMTLLIDSSDAGRGGIEVLPWAAPQARR